MSSGAATDRTRDEAWEQSRGCPHCGGSGQATVYDRAYDGRRVVERECLVRGEVKPMPCAMTVVAHCGCPLGRWMRAKTDRDLLARIPDLLDVLAGRSRFVAQDPTGDDSVDWRRLSPRRAVEGLAAKMGAS